MPYFLYEVNLYKITGDMASLLGSRFFKSDKALEIKNDVTVKKFKGYSVIRYIDMLGAPIEFIKENKLPLYKPKKKLKKKKKK